MAAEPIRILLHDNGEDVETMWAVPVESPPGRTFVRLDNVPFLHARPTYGDTLEVAEDEAQPGWLSWNRAGCPFEEIPERLVVDGGRYAVIVDYTCDDLARFAALTRWARESADLHGEGAYSPDDSRPGRLYLAVPYATAPDAVMAILGANPHGFSFVLVHPV
ncbi:MAG: hypothetical protein Q7U06_01460 [Pseudomonadota bacterium]|nr:hypothetical protein [Pseudomonadota bacterium]